MSDRRADLIQALLEIKGMHAVFRKRAKKKTLKKGKIFEILGKNIQKLKIFWKKAGDCLVAHNKL